MALLVVFVLLWCTLEDGVESARGVSLRFVHAVSPQFGFLDALWHLGTAFVLVLPARDRRIWLLGPPCALGIDVDHVFGSIVPAPFPRVAHTLFFALFAVGGFAATRLRIGMMVAPAAWSAHVAVDGGVFPIFAPFTASQFGLPYPVAVGMVAASGLLFFLSARPVRELAEPRALGPLAGSIALVALLVFAIGSPFSVFSSG